MKRSKTTDAPIYIYFAYRIYDKENHRIAPTIQNQLIVVDDDFKVTKSDLPDLGYYSYLNCNIAVSNSCLHLVTVRGRLNSGFKGIFSVKIDGVGKWDEIPLGRDGDPDECWSIGGTAVAGEQNWIYGVGLDGRLFAFNPNSKTFQFIMFGPDASDSSRPFMLGVSDNRIYANFQWPNRSLVGYYDLKSLTWETLNPDARLHKVVKKVVVVKDFYLVDFSVAHPSTGDFQPALYVFDIKKGVWLSDPVKGLVNDGHQLPALDGFDPEEESIPVYDTSLLEVRRDEQLRLALVWRYLRNGSVFRMSKFTLAIDGHENGDPTFQAKDVRSFEPHSVNAIVMRLKTTTAYD